MDMHLWKMLLFFMLVLGFAYIVWLKALKREGVVRKVGQVIAVITVILAIVTLIYSGLSGWKCGMCHWGKSKYMGKPYYHRGMMDKHPGRGMMDRDHDQEMMEPEEAD
ncbi:MAG: hypothetical protein ABH859_06640 [Pseudomonadota bacterium]